jgi:SRSO17 transposase
MDVTELDRVEGLLRRFHARFAPLFGRREARERSEQYLRGLLVQREERRSAENLAEAIEGATPRTLQLFLSDSPWSERAVRDELQAYVGERLGSSDAAFLLDETGFAKQGTKSVGVARQYSGTLGKVGNCQIGVFLTYASAKGHATVDARLFLPEEWTTDPARCRAAGVPEAVDFRTKPELALELLQQARQWAHLPGRWVAADEVYGNSPVFRDGVDALGLWYVGDIACDLPVFTEEAATAVPPYSGRGRRPVKPRLVPGAAPAQEVQALARALPEHAWQELEVAEGAQGPRVYRFARLRVWESRDALPGRACWLLLRTNLDGSEPRYALSNAPVEVSLLRLAQVQTTRWRIETEFETLKGEVGLDEYEVRGWRGWHHHVTLCLLAGAFLLSLQQEWGEKDAPAHPPTGRARAQGDPAPAPVEPSGVARLAGGNAAAKRGGQAEPLQTKAPSQTLPAPHAA